MTSLPELQALTDEHLIEAVATRVMGWPVAELDGERHVRLPNHVPPVALLSKYWNPLTDWNHTMEIVTRTAMRGRVQRYMNTIWEIQGPDEWLRMHPPQRAICLAALFAVSHD